MADEKVTAMTCFRAKLKAALKARDSDKTEYQLALVERHLDVLKQIDQNVLSEAVRVKVQAEINMAQDDWEQADSVLAMARGMNKVKATVTAETHTRLKWNWKPIPFAGKEGEWLGWWQLFSSSVHEDSTVKSEWKMKALIECLQGSAADVLGKLEHTGANYEKAIELLKTRFGNPQNLSKAYYRELEQLPPAAELKAQQTLDKVAAIVNNLEALRDQVTVDENFVVRHIWRKFPAELSRWAINSLEPENPQNMKFTPLQVIGALDKQMKVDCYLASQLQEEETAVGTKAVGVLVAGGYKRPAEPPKPKTCVFCTCTHPSADCRRFSTIISRRNRLTELKRCHNCLIPHHDATKCRRPIATCGRCSQRHVTALCTVQGAKRNKQGKYLKFKSSFLQTFVCIIINTKTGKVYETRGLFDPGSHYSFISFELIRKLDLIVNDQISLDCATFPDSNATKLNGYHVNVTLRNSENACKTVELITTPCITGDISTGPPPEETIDLLPSSIDYADYDIFQFRQRPIKILIGADLYHSFVDIRSSYELDNGVNMINSFFGWFPSGGVKEIEPPTKKHCAGLMVGQDLQSKAGSSLINAQQKPIPEICENLILDDINLEFMWTLEVLGIENPNKETEKGVEYVLDLYKNTTYIDHLNRKNIRIPWKDLKTALPSNFRVALARLKGLVEKTPPEQLKIGDEHFKQQEKEGIIELAPPMPKFDKYNIIEKRRVHYMPHRWLFQKGKIRVVYDASAPTKSGISLNQIIYQGANLTTNIVRLLLNFRLYKIALVADIEKAFLQISLNEVDRDASRFLWLKDITKPATDGNLVYYRFARLPMGLNVSPYILNMVLTDTFNAPPINKWLVNGQNLFYADNLVTSVQKQTDALSLFDAMTTRLSSIQMNLRDWATNDGTVSQAFPPEKVDKTTGKLSVLGLPWDRFHDILTIKYDENKPLEGTKRNVLKFYASIFDPLGLISPCTLELKLFIQQCWKQSYQWNARLPPTLEAEWLKLRTDALKINEIPIPRHYFDNSEPASYDLHIFCDASQKAYACCAYLCHKDVHLQLSTKLVFSKVRIAPPQRMTIPKLELMAVVIGKRVALFLKENLTISIDHSYLWTDATTILHWLDTKDILPPFVQNRISEIKQAKDLIIRYVNTTDNPADLASRGQSVNLLKNSTLWWQGPNWLSHQQLWPKPPLNVQTVTLLTSMPKPLPESLLSLNLENNFKTWSSRIKVFYYVLKACFLASKQPFYATEIEATRVAEKLLIIDLQQKYFAKDLYLLKKGSHPKSNLDLFLDNQGIIRCRGRLHYARFPWETKHPIYLPRDSPAIFSLIKEIHNKHEHIGVSHTLAKLRETYWISKGRAKVKSVLHTCHKCRYWYGGSYPLPPMPPLPEARVADVTPFLQVGIDAFGPLHIYNSNNEVIDVQVLIFTCLVTRAIHLEAVPDLTGEQFLLALQRFCSLKRVPKLIISDNAKTFVFLQPMIGIKVRISDHKINHLLASNRIEWYFIPQYAPWFGGSYERLIGLIKKCLRIAYGKILLTYLELQTVLYKIADILNSRPLTYISDEVVEPLTPNHFLRLGNTNVNLDLEVQAKPPLSNTGAALINKWGVLNRILDGYWDAFHNLYLLSLRERHITRHKEKKGVSKFRPQVDDIVLIQEPSTPRAYWKLGKIEKLDKRQAVAFVRSKGALLIRSIRHLYPLEVQRDPSQTTA